MNIVLVNAAKFLACYAAWGLVTVCDPVLISEESAKGSKILSVAKDVTDCVVTGCKLAFIAPIIAIASISKKD